MLLSSVYMQLVTMRKKYVQPFPFDRETSSFTIKEPVSPSSMKVNDELLHSILQKGVFRRSRPPFNRLLWHILVSYLHKCKTCKRPLAFTSTSTSVPPPPHPFRLSTGLICKRDHIGCNIWLSINQNIKWCLVYGLSTLRISNWLTRY